MRFNTKICIVLFMLSLCGIGAQNKPRVWDTRDGLSNNWISDISQDDKGYIWLATQYGLNRFDGYTFESITHNPEDRNSPVANWVKRIAKKSKNELWLGVDYGGLDSYDITKNEFDHLAIVHQKDTITSINKLLTDQNGSLYVATDGGLFKKTNDTNGFERVFGGKVIDLFKNIDGDIFFLSSSGIFAFNAQRGSCKKVIDNSEERINNIFIDSGNRIFGLENGMLSIYSNSNGTYTISRKLKLEALVSLRFADNPIIEDSENRIWIGGEKGISIVDKNRDAIEFHSYLNLFEKDLEGVQALSFFEDVHKNIWIGTNKGLALISTFSNRFQSKNILTIGTDLHDIREFNQVNGTLLIAANEGLFSVNEENQVQSILNKKIYGMHVSDSGHIYAIGNGFYEIDTTSFKVKVLSSSYFKGGWSIAEDASGDLWMVSIGNLICYRKDSGVFETYDTKKMPKLNDIPIIDLLVDANGRLWLCSLYSGVYVLQNPQELKLGGEPQFSNINYISGNKKSLSHRLVTSLLEASDGTIWVGTDAGLNAINPLTFEVKRYLKKDGLKDEKIMALTEDDFGNIWGSTVGNGIFQLDNKTEGFNFFGQEDGLNSSNFLLSSAYKNAKGLLFFGTDAGMEVVNPKLFKDFVKPKIDFFFTHAQLVPQASEETVRKISPQQDEIILDHEHNSFIINYTTLNYHLAEKTKYQYRVGNLSDTWQNNGSERGVTFNSLSPGEYELEVVAMNPDLDFITDRLRLKITITPPWWRTKLAYCCYFLFLLSIFFGVHKYVLRRNLDIAEKRRLQELDVFKTTFFNNVAHEFKTPLAVISGMANNLRKKRNKEIDHSAKTIIRNSNELNDLVNQILDLSKLDVGKLNLTLAHGDIIVYLKYILGSFGSLAAAKEIRLHFLSSVETLFMDFDAQKIKFIFSNLLSNAIKNTPVKGDVYLQISHRDLQAEFVVKDNGIGISKEDLKLVFERYHQVKGHMGGTGIGLSFTKELVHLMNGTISAKSTIGQGSSFKVILPIVHKATEQILFDKEYQTIHLDRRELRPNSSEMAITLPIVQIIEDNLDICSYLESILRNEYHLNFDHNGDSGVKNVFETVPDLVITDLMMPGKDGFEVCNEIKSNPITDHIPIIMLTAKSDSESKLEGLKLGADAYLEKPFDEKELTIRIAKLLEQREILRKKYRNPDFWKQNDSEVKKETDAFILKARTIIEENIGDSRFGILELCRALGVSRSNLHRKLKALTDLSTSAFIQMVKLQKARQLLKTTEKNVSEVAYEVGYDDPAYFSRLFSKTFGYPPSETRKNQ